MRKLPKKKKRDIEAVKYRWEFLRRNKQYIQDWKKLQIVLKDKDNFKTLSAELSIDFTEPSEEDLEELSIDFTEPSEEDLEELARFPREIPYYHRRYEVEDVQWSMA